MDIFYPRISENSSMQIAPTFLLKFFAHSFFWLTLSLLYTYAHHTEWLLSYFFSQELLE